MAKFGVFKSSEKALAIGKYLNKSFNLARSYPITMDIEDDGSFSLVIDDYANQFTNDIQKMQNAATDFWAGWQAHKHSLNN